MPNVLMIKVSQKSAARQVGMSICVGLSMFSLPIWGIAQTQVGSAVNSSREIVCISNPNVAALSVRYTKGSVRHNSDTGSAAFDRYTRLESGDTVSTGIDGFVSIQMSDRIYKNIHPNSVVVIGVVAI